jgi:hypothetical protein
MEFDNARALDRKSGARLGEPGAPVGFLRVCFKLRILG